VREPGGGQTGKGTWIGGGVGAIVGLFAPPFLLAAAIGAGIGAVAGELTKKHDEKRMGVDLDAWYSHLTVEERRDEALRGRLG
jgi:hypothetical protein